MTACHQFIFSLRQLSGGPCKGYSQRHVFAQLPPIHRLVLLPMMSVVAICLGASVGALARWGLGLWLSPGGLLAWGTLAANLVGGYLIGVCIAVLQSMPQLDPVWRLLLITGFLGGLTTFSSFSAEVVGFLMQERYALALCITSLHVLGSLLLTLAGIKSALFLIALSAR